MSFEVDVLNELIAVGDLTGDNMKFKGKFLGAPAVGEPGLVPSEWSDYGIFTTKALTENLQQFQEEMGSGENFVATFFVLDPGVRKKEPEEGFNAALVENSDRTDFQKSVVDLLRRNTRLASLGAGWKNAASAIYKMVMFPEGSGQANRGWQRSRVAHMLPGGAFVHGVSNEKQALAYQKQQIETALDRTFHPRNAS